MSKGTVSPSKQSSLKWLKALADNWYMGKNGKEYDISEVNALIWEKEAAIKDQTWEDAPEDDLTCISDEDLASRMREAIIFQDPDLGDIQMEVKLRMGHFD